MKKAYDLPEEEGFTVTVHGKGTYVAAMNTERMLEEYKKEIESEFEETIRKSKRYGISREDVKELFELIMDEW